ncbi:hypothetical protein SPFL3102_00912 [Sporomusaceae bacterium FL31]|nr:hypothetical protein SPFL3101_02963 [Sporomusaceae bacterium FL31]GCE33111.1 hypothetical protein SPFL3102_00912 [Sporomusaceae bacterium]
MVILASTPPWRKAIATSILIHIILFVSAGYFTIGLFSVPPVNEQYIELDLSQQTLSDSREQVETAIPQIAEQSASAEIDPAIPLPVMTEAPQSAQPAATPIFSQAANDSSLAKTTISNLSSGSSTGPSNQRNTSFAPPRILSKVEPSYPTAARQAEQQGTAILSVQILENGRSGVITIIQSSGYDLLDNAAMAAVKQWRFAPAKDLTSGKSVSCYSTLPVSFSLK